MRKRKKKFYEEGDENEVSLATTEIEKKATVLISGGDQKRIFRTLPLLGSSILFGPPPVYIQPDITVR